MTLVLVAAIGVALVLLLMRAIWRMDQREDER